MIDSVVTTSCALIRENLCLSLLYTSFSFCQISPITGFYRVNRCCYSTGKKDCPLMILEITKGQSKDTHLSGIKSVVHVLILNIQISFRLPDRQPFTLHQRKCSYSCPPARTGPAYCPDRLFPGHGFGALAWSCNTAKIPESRHCQALGLRF